MDATTERRQSTTAYAPPAATSCEPLEAAQRRVRQLKAAQRAKEDAHALAAVLPVIRELEATGVRVDNRVIAQALNDRGVRTAYGRTWYGHYSRKVLLRMAQISAAQCVEGVSPKLPGNQDVVPARSSALAP
jgi:hypothetical protein